MTAAVIVTNSKRTMKKNKQPFVVRLIEKLKPSFDEIILISERPSLYLPYVKDGVRILTPYYKGRQPLSSLHTSLSLAKSDEIWLLHEDLSYPGFSVFNKMRTMKERCHSQGVLFQNNSQNCLIYGLFDKSVLSVLENKLNTGDDKPDHFLQQIKHTYFSDHTTKSL